MEKFLEKEPKARERKFKDKAIGRILQDRHIRTKEYPIEQLTEIVGEVLALDRSWRLILEKREELRGTDYKDKEKLEQETMVALDYQSQFHQDVKAFDKIN